MSVPPIQQRSIDRFRECLYAAAAKITGRIRYLESVKNSQRLQIMRLSEENLNLRRLAKIAPGAVVPKVEEQ